MTRRNPHNPEQPETTLFCLHVILEEMWEHLRFAVRDLCAIEAQEGLSRAPTYTRALVKGEADG